MKKIKNGKYLFFLVSFLVFVIGFHFLKAATYNFEGFMWIGNNSYGDRTEGDATIGMISVRGKTLDNKNYGMILNESLDGGSTRLITGEAWIGIGGKNGQFKNFKEDNSNINNSISVSNNTSSLGWIRFNQGIPASGCFNAGDCHPVRWNKKTGSSGGSLEGYLSGWAKFSIGIQSGDSVNWANISVENRTSPLTYPDVWVHFKAPSSTGNYSCDIKNDQHNYVCVDNLGKLSGFAWSSGTESQTFSSNPGFGWLGFNQDKDGQNLAYITSSGGTASNLSRFCSTRLSSSSDMLCKKVGDTAKSFNFSAYYQDSSIAVSSVNRDGHFRWKCSGDSSEAYKYGENITCDYGKAGTFIPSLEIEDSSTNIWIECSKQAIANVVDTSECMVLVRKADATSEDEFLQEINLEKDDLAEAKIIRKCLETGNPVWTTNGSISFTGNDTIKFRLSDSAAVTTVSAVIGGTTCSQAQINTKDYVEWR